MTHAFDCVATGIGSLPLSDPDKAATLVLECLPEAPIWPQLPQRSFREHMGGQYSEVLPGIQIDTEKERFFFNTAQDLMPEFERFFERYLEKDYDFFKMTEEYASGFYALLRALQKQTQAMRFIKGHITGPLTAGISLKDEAGKDIIHHEMLFDAVVKCLAMKASWQIQELKQFGKPVIIFIDEPAMESLGSAFSAVSAATVVEKLNEIIDAIHEMGGIAGIHCCGNADWPMLFNTRIDIVNFDAFGYMNKLLLYPADIKTFYNRGGSLAWGIVPTGSFTGTETADGLIEILEAGIQRLEQEGMDRNMILHQCLITPSCGMGSLGVEQSEAILKLVKKVSGKMRKTM